MRLQAQSPRRVGKDVANHLGRVLARAGLKEVIGGGKGGVSLQRLPGIDHFQLVHSADGQRCALLRRAGDPIYAIGQCVCAVGLDANILARRMQAAHEGLVYPQRRLSAREDYHAAGVDAYSGHDLIVAHQLALFVACVAEGAAQVAARETDEYGGCTRVVTLALQAVEYLVNLSHRWPCFLLILAPPP